VPGLRSTGAGSGDSLSESEFIGLFETVTHVSGRSTGERYLSAARSVRAPIRFAVLFL